MNGWCYTQFLKGKMDLECERLINFDRNNLVTNICKVVNNVDKLVRIDTLLNYGSEESSNETFPVSKSRSCGRLGWYRSAVVGLLLAAAQQKDGGVTRGETWEQMKSMN